MIHLGGGGGVGVVELKEPGWLNKRSREYLEEFHQAQDQLIIPVMNTSVNVNV